MCGGNGAWVRRYSASWQMRRLVLILRFSGIHALNLLRDTGPVVQAYRLAAIRQAQETFHVRLVAIPDRIDEPRRRDRQAESRYAHTLRDGAQNSTKNMTHGR